MIRLIFVETDSCQMIYCGAPNADVTYKSFDIEAPEIEAWLREPREKKFTNVTRSFVGMEQLNEAGAEGK